MVPINLEFDGAGTRDRTEESKAVSKEDLISFGEIDEDGKEVD